MFRDDQIAALESKLDARHVKQRQQAGRNLSYVEGWHAIAEANRIFGFHAWDRELRSISQLGEPREVDGKWRVAYMATVRVTVYAGEQDVVRDGTGYGSGIDRDPGSAHESAIKEAETDAMKRALMTFGNPFGLALYDKEQANVEHAPPPPPPPKASPSDFWKRDTYTLPAKTIGEWTDRFCNACAAAPTQISIDKLIGDNHAFWDGALKDSHLAARLKDAVDARRDFIANPPNKQAAE